MADKKETGGGFLERVSRAVDSGLTSFFQRLGGRIADKPGTTIGLSLLVALFFTSGFAFFEIESNPDRLYTPQDSRAFGDEDYVEATYGFEPLDSSIFGVARSDGDLLNSASLLELLDSYDALVATTAQSGGRTWTFAETCNKPLSAAGDDRCDVQSVLDLWSYDRATIAALTDSEIRDAVSEPELRDVLGRSMRLGAILGGIETGAGGRVESARAAQIEFAIKNEKRPISGEEDGDPEAQAFEKAASAAVYAAARDNSLVNVEVYAESVEEEEQDKAIEGDIGLLTFGYIAIIFYSMLVLGRRNVVGSRSWLALAAVLAVGLAIGAGFGLASALGVDFALPVATVPFLLIGLGVDDAFVIMSAHRQLKYDAEKSGLSARDRIALALGRAGPSITLTSATDVIAFLCGAITDLPALESFGIYAALCILFVFVFQCTFFVACVALDSRREQARRRDLLCCLPPVSEKKASAKACSSEPFDEGKPGVVGTLIGDTLPKVTIGSKAGKAGVLVVSTALVAIAASQIIDLETNFKIEWFTPDNSFMQDVYDVRDEFFAGTNLPYGVYFQASDPEADYFANRAGLEAAAAAMRADRWTLDGSVSAWYTDFGEWLDAEHAGDARDADGRLADRALFYQRVGEFLADDTTETGGAGYAGDVLLNDAGDGIVASRFTANFIVTANSDEDVEGMRASRRSAAAAGEQLDGMAFAGPYAFFEGTAVIRDELVRNVLLALLGVFVVSTLLLASLPASLLVLAMVGMVDLCVLGFFPIVGVDINSVSTINVVIAVGIAVDQSAHIAHAFMVATGTRDERATAALRKIGGSVANGAFSTFIAVAIMAASQSYVFRIFNRVLTLVVIFGVWFGLVALPVILSLIGPPPYSPDASSAHTVEAFAKVGSKPPASSAADVGDVEMPPAKEHTMSV